MDAFNLIQFNSIQFNSIHPTEAAAHIDKKPNIHRNSTSYSTTIQLCYMVQFSHPIQKHCTNILLDQTTTHATLLIFPKKSSRVRLTHCVCFEEASKSTAFVYVFVTRSTCCPPTCVCGKLIVFFFSISLLLVAVDCSLVATRHSPARVVYQRGGSTTVVLCRRILLVVVHKGLGMPSAVRFEIQVLHLPDIKPPFRQGLPVATVMIPILDGRAIQLAIFKGRIIIIAIIAGAAQCMHEPFVKGRRCPMNERQG